MANQWIIDQTHGGRTGNDLMDCKIKEIEDADGLHYELTSRNNELWSVTPGPVLPGTPFEFPKFRIPDGPPWLWEVGVESLDVDQGNKAIGSWSNNKPKSEGPPEDESGTWTAQAGGGMGDDGKEDVASASA